MFTADAAVGVRPVQVLAGVDFGGNNLKEVGTGGLCNILGHPLGVTGSGVVDHQRLAGFGLSPGSDSAGAVEELSDGSVAGCSVGAEVSGCVVEDAGLLTEPQAARLSTSTTLSSSAVSFFMIKSSFQFNFSFIYIRRECHIFHRGSTFCRRGSRYLMQGFSVFHFVRI